VRRRHASHITVVLSKAAHSGPSVCLRARAPCPLRVSCPGTDRAERAAQAAGVSVQCKLQALALPCLHWVKTGYEPWRSAHARTRTNSCASLLRSTSVCTSLRTVQTHLCLCAKYCGVSRRVRPVSFVDDVVQSLTLLYFPGSFLSRTPRVKTCQTTTRQTAIMR
jgi:hypothetical protein